MANLLVEESNKNRTKYTLTGTSHSASLAPTSIPLWYLRKQTQKKKTNHKTPRLQQEKYQISKDIRMKTKPTVTYSILIENKIQFYYSQALSKYPFFLRMLHASILATWAQSNLQNHFYSETYFPSKLFWEMFKENDPILYK